MSLNKGSYLYVLSVIGISVGSINRLGAASEKISKHDTGDKDRKGKEKENVALSLASSSSRA